jgi:hypothetical protein
MLAQFIMIESSWLFAIVHSCSPRVDVRVAVKQLVQMLGDAIAMSGLEDQHAAFRAVQGCPGVA